MAVSKNGKYLYSIEDEGVAVFKRDKNGDLSRINSVNIDGMRAVSYTHLQQIWGRCSDNDVASLRVFMATLRKKLEPEKNGVQYIQTHIGIGYRMLRIEK